MPNFFYSNLEYKQKQALITKKNWENGIYNFRRNLKEKRLCKNPKCDNTFLVKHSELKTYCSRRCSGLVNNKNRTLSEITKRKISLALKLLPKEKRGIHFTKTKVKMICLNCHKLFELVPYLSRTQKYCSVRCAIKVTGRLTTSSKASKGKNGVRVDIDSNINFYSTWEANVARVYNLVKLRWEYAPKIFNLGEHTYRPDFYLPGFKTYIEVKNFMNEYSTMRDKLFRIKFPNIKLELILKNDYLNIIENYKDLVEAWEN